VSSPTGATDPSRNAPIDPSASPAGLSESEYLKRQADAASAAISRAFAELKTDLGRGADPRMWVKSHPWITLASAAVAGFAAASSAIPSKEQVALKKLEAIERAIHRAHHPNEAAENGNGNGTGKPATTGVLPMLLKEVLSIIKPVLLSILTAKMAPPEPFEPAPPMADSQDKMPA
jgi:hypothetical protein